MQLFIEYIQPMIHWLHYNPEWALLITFLISFTESLAIIGSIIPGSVTMTGIGILAGSGVIPIDKTFLAATLGAVTGDGASYLLGYFFSDQLVKFWPFRRYPQWLAYGKDYFARHGGKSVLIGRFIGPLRSIIPVIAGMMHMSHWRFYTANFISAILWSILYILPGVILGAASTELPPEIATKLFLLVLAILIGIWLVSMLIKYLLLQLNHYLNASLNQLWECSKQNQYIGAWIRSITPHQELNHYPTAVLCISISFLLVIAIILIGLLLNGQTLFNLNNPLSFAMQSLRNETIDYIFIIITQFVSILPLALISIFTLVLCLVSKHFRLLSYYISLLLSTSLIIFLCHSLIQCPHPIGILEVLKHNSFPSPNLTFATALFTSFLLFLNQNRRFKCKSSFNICFIVLLLFVGVGQMLLGDYWFTDILGAYVLGLLVCLIHWVFYRKKHTGNDPTTYLVLPYVSLLLIGTIVSSQINFEGQYRDHQPFFKQFIFTNNVWWSQSKPILPLYRKNRFGHSVSLFNLQYAGSLDTLTSTLINAGWTRQNESFYKTLMKYPVYREVPTIPQLYLNRKPSLTMRYQLNETGPILILRLWRSNYYLQDYQQHVWIGSVHTRIPLKKYKPSKPNATTPVYYVEQALGTQFLHRQLQLSILKHQTLPFRVDPILLLIREKPQPIEPLQNN